MPVSRRGRDWLVAFGSSPSGRASRVQIGYAELSNRVLSPDPLPVINSCPVETVLQDSGAGVNLSPADLVEMIVIDA
ncbi:MAG: hypothetical protein ACE5FV_10485, partial [Woeseia sp.]